MNNINGITTIMPKIYIDKICQDDINFENDELYLYVVDRKLHLNKFLKYKKEIKDYVLYSKRLFLPVITDDGEEYYVEYDDVEIKYDSYKYPTFGNIVIYNESRNYIMSMMLLDEEIFLGYEADWLDKVRNSHIKTFTAQDICFRISKCLIGE